MALMDNPLNRAAKQNRLPEFTAIDPVHVMPAIEHLLGEYREGVTRQLELTPDPGWELVEAETRWADSLARAWSPVSHLNSVLDNEALRAAYNAGLSLRRAQSVRDYLVGKGANAGNLTVKGYGESDPVASNDTDEGRQQNRRVECIVMGFD